LCWTRKEAFIKAKGKGLSIPLDQFDVSLTPEQPAELLNTDFNRKEVSRWSLFDLPQNIGYAAALAVEGKIPWKIIYREWEESE
jgi:4'-phosphopantetheinyl transferase